MLPFSILPWVTVRMVPPRITTSFWGDGMSAVGCAGVAAAASASRRVALPGSLDSALTRLLAPGDECDVCFACWPTAIELSRRSNITRIAGELWGMCGSFSILELRDSIQANADWQITQMKRLAVPAH